MKGAKYAAQTDRLPENKSNRRNLLSIVSHARQLMGNVSKPHNVHKAPAAMNATASVATAYKRPAVGEQNKKNSMWRLALGPAMSPLDARVGSLGKNVRSKKQSCDEQQSQSQILRDIIKEKDQHVQELESKLKEVEARKRNKFAALRAVVKGLNEKTDRIAGLLSQAHGIILKTQQKKPRAAVEPRRPALGEKKLGYLAGKLRELVKTGFAGGEGKKRSALRYPGGDGSAEKQAANFTSVRSDRTLHEEPSVSRNDPHEIVGKYKLASGPRGSNAGKLSQLLYSSTVGKSRRKGETRVSNISGKVDSLLKNSARGQHKPF